jgi:lactate racemase
VFAPNAGAALTDAQIAERLESPTGLPTVRELCRGKARPLVIVDDLNRPTPASRILPVLLRQFEDAGIPARDVGIVMATGTHGAPPPDALAKKVGPEAAGSCRLHVHDCYRDVVKVGRTSFGTPVFVNKHVVESDFLVGVGGLYPNQTAGFGGGSKLALGVLGFRSIAGLHYGHESMGWGTPNNRSHFRRDLDEIARMIGLNTMVSVLVNADREVVELTFGDPNAYYGDMLGSTKDAFRAPPPDERADVIISNAYPGDLSLTFVRMKGIAPLKIAPPGASRIAIASLHEGLGFHGLYPFMNAPRYHKQRMLVVRGRALLGKPGTLVHKVLRRLRRLGSRWGAGTAPLAGAPTGAGNPIWLYRTDGGHTAGLPADIPGMRVTSSWDEILAAVSREQGGRTGLRAMLYSCAAIQWLG